MINSLQPIDPLGITQRNSICEILSYPEAKVGLLVSGTFLIIVFVVDEIRIDLG